MRTTEENWSRWGKQSLQSCRWRALQQRNDTPYFLHCLYSKQLYNSRISHLNWMVCILRMQCSDFSHYSQVGHIDWN